MKVRVGVQDTLRTRTISDVEGIARQERGDGAMADPVFGERLEFRVSRSEPVFLSFTVCWIEKLIQVWLCCVFGHASVSQDLLIEAKSRYILRSKLLASHATSVLDLTPEANRTYDLWLPLEISPDIRTVVGASPPQVHVLVTRHEGHYEVPRTFLFPFEATKLICDNLFFF